MIEKWIKEKMIATYKDIRDETFLRYTSCDDVMNAKLYCQGALSFLVRSGCLDVAEYMSFRDELMNYGKDKSCSN